MKADYTRTIVRPHKNKVQVWLNGRPVWIPIAEYTKQTGIEIQPPPYREKGNQPKGMGWVFHGFQKNPYITAMTENKNKGGRPSKLPRFLEVAEKVLSDGDKVLAFTDEELLDEINDNLEPDERISFSAFKQWKAGKLPDINSDLVKRFLSLVKKALRIEKHNLLKTLRKGENGWQAKAWIIERKWGDWNLKNVNLNVEKTVDELTDEELDAEIKALLSAASA